MDGYGSVPVELVPNSVSRCKFNRDNISAAIKVCNDQDTCAGIVVGPNEDGTVWACTMDTGGPDRGSFGTGLQVCMYLKAD